MPGVAMDRDPGRCNGGPEDLNCSETAGAEGGLAIGSGALAIEGLTAAPKKPGGGVRGAGTAFAFGGFAGSGGAIEYAGFGTKGLTFGGPVGGSQRGRGG